MADLHKYRPDVDGLRAIAILAVVAYHAFPEFVSGGFVGVDVFFVVSGYLISDQIREMLARGDFSFGAFYARRVRRLFPALLLVLCVTVAAGWFVLLPDEFREMGKHLAGGAGFAANFMLWQEAGYFDALAVLKPLLHLWSLSIEEQFYLVWPLFMLLAWRRPLLMLPAIGALAVVSFAANLATVGSNAVAAFYSPLSRFFELLAGCALAAWRPAAGAVPRGLGSACGLLMIAGSSWLLDREAQFPGAWALLPVVGTSLVVWAGSEAAPNRLLLAHPALVWVGLISYPLYLWHWPLLSFARILERGEASATTRILLVSASVLLAWLTNVFVERPVRFGARRALWTPVLSSLMAVAGAAGLAVYYGEGLPWRAIGGSARDLMAQAEWHYWNDSACVRRYGVEPCESNSDRPEVMVLGDSHANHLYPGLTQTEPALKVIQAGSCPPLAGVRLYVLKNADRHPCAGTDYLGQNLRILAEQPQIRLVILASLWRNALTGELLNAREKQTWGGVRLQPESDASDERSNPDLVLLGLSGTIAALRARGLAVVFVRDTPDIGAELVEYCKLGPRFNPRECSLPRRDFLKYREAEDALVRELGLRFAGLPVYDPIDALCGPERCYLMRDGVLLYRDNHHLSVNGSRRIALHMKRWLADNRLL